MRPPFLVLLEAEGTEEDRRSKTSRGWSLLRGLTPPPPTHLAGPDVIMGAGWAAPYLAAFYQVCLHMSPRHGGLRPWEYGLVRYRYDLGFRETFDNAYALGGTEAVLPVLYALRNDRR